MDNHLHRKPKIVVKVPFLFDFKYSLLDLNYAAFKWWKLLKLLNDKKIQKISVYYLMNTSELEKT